jgi:hypothetical protein
MNEMNEMNETEVTGLVEAEDAVTSTRKRDAI